MLVFNRIVAIALTIASCVAFIMGDIDRATYMLLYIVLLDLQYYRNAE